jgi:hypothetical protein
LAACRIDSEASPQFNTLREHWRKSGYPSVNADLAEAFEAITKEVQAKHCKVMPRFTEILGGYTLHKYRQKNSAAKEGASGGWRIVAIFDKSARVLYPIILYPKKAMSEASDKQITECVLGLLKILQQRRGQAS